jgi:hypothetical protein
MVRTLSIASALIGIALLLPGTVRARTWEVTGDTVNAGQRITNALLNAVDGDRIHIASPGTYIAPAGGWILKKSLEIYGDGVGNQIDPQATFLRPADDSNPVLVIQSDSASSSMLENLYIHDLQIGQNVWPGPTTLKSNSYGIYYSQGSSTKDLVTLRLERLFINGMANDGIHLDGDSRGITGVSMVKVVSTENAGSGLWIYHSSLVNVVDSYFSRNQMAGAKILGCGAARVMWSAFEENWKGTPDPGGGTVGHLTLAGSHGFLVHGCHFEEWDDRNGSAQDPLAMTAMYVYDCVGGQIGSCSFGNETLTTNSRAIFLGYTAPLTNIVIQPNVFSAVDIAIELQDTPTLNSCVIFPQAHFGQYGPGKVIVPEAVDLGHVVLPTTKHGFGGITAGIELPRLSVARRDSMAAPGSGGTRREGLFSYNNDVKALNYWDGSRWRQEVAFFPTTTAANAPPGGINLPAITSTTRDNMPTAFKTAGTLIFNSSTNELNYWNGSAWRAVTNKNP